MGCLSSPGQKFGPVISKGFFTHDRKDKDVRNKCFTVGFSKQPHAGISRFGAGLFFARNVALRGKIVKGIPGPFNRS